MKKLVLGLVAVVLVVGGVLLVRGHGLEKKPDTTLPAVTLTPLGDSQPVDLKTLKGPVVLNFWANWCGPCQKEMPIYQQFHAANPDVRLLGVNTLDTQPVLARRLLAKAGTTYPQVRDPEGKVLGAKYLPVLVMVDAQGKVVYRKAIQIHSVAELQKLVREHLGKAAA